MSSYVPSSKAPPPPPMRSALDKQEGGSHYKDMKIQPVEFIHANNIPFIEGCIIKYASRWRDKNGISDLRKIIHFAELLIELDTKHANIEVKESIDIDSLKEAWDSGKGKMMPMVNGDDQPWYPDDSGEWVEVYNGNFQETLRADELIEILTEDERTDKEMVPANPQASADWIWDQPEQNPIVAYKKVNP